MPALAQRNLMKTVNSIMTIHRIDEIDYFAEVCIESKLLDNYKEI